MAQKIQTLLVDDLDGSEADGTVRFEDREAQPGRRYGYRLRSASGEAPMAWIRRAAASMSSRF